MKLVTFLHDSLRDHVISRVVNFKLFGVTVVLPTIRFSSVQFANVWGRFAKDYKSLDVGGLTPCTSHQLASTKVGNFSQLSGNFGVATECRADFERALFLGVGTIPSSKSTFSLPS